MATRKLVIAALVTAVLILAGFAGYLVLLLNNDAPKVIPTPPSTTIPIVTTTTA